MNRRERIHCRLLGSDTNPISVVNKIGGLISCLLLATACGGPGFEPPTAIPADVVVPSQPVPIYADEVSRFTVKTPTPSSVILPDQAVSAAPLTAIHSRSSITLPYQQMPSALGVVRGGAVLRSAPDGDRIDILPAGETVTITGRSLDGSAYAVFDLSGVAGWIGASTVTVFGGDDLLVVDEAPEPGPIATLIAEAMQPLAPSVLEGVGIDEK